MAESSSVARLRLFVWFTCCLFILMGSAALAFGQTSAVSPQPAVNPGIGIEISGRITDVAGAPVTCAAVEATFQGSVDTAVTVTDLNGNYFFANLSPGVYDLRILAPDFGAFDGGSVDITQGSRSNVDFELTPAQETTVYGHVSDAQSGEPLVGVLVEVLSNDQVMASSYTCASGNYAVVVTGLLPKQTATVNVRFSLPNYATDLQQAIAVPSEGVQVDSGMEKSAVFPATLSGTVIEAGTSPAQDIGNAQVTIQGPVNMTATTAPDGSYVFSAILAGTYIVTASATGYQSSATTVVVPNGLATQDFALTPTGCTAPDAPTGINATDGTFADRVRVTWGSVGGATSYRVYRSTTNSFSSAAQLAEVASLSYDDLSAKKAAGATLPSPNKDIEPRPGAGAALIIVALALMLIRIARNRSGDKNARRSGPLASVPGRLLVALVLVGLALTSCPPPQPPPPQATVYYYWVIAVNTCGQSAPSTSDSGHTT